MNGGRSFLRPGVGAVATFTAPALVVDMKMRPLLDGPHASASLTLGPITHKPEDPPQQQPPRAAAATATAAACTAVLVVDIIIVAITAHRAFIVDDNTTSQTNTVHNVTNTIRTRANAHSHARETQSSLVFKARELHQRRPSLPLRLPPPRLCRADRKQWETEREEKERRALETR